MGAAPPPESGRARRGQTAPVRLTWRVTWRWWTPAELKATDEELWPAGSGRAGHLALGKDGDSIDGKRVVQTLEDVGLNQGVYPEEGQDGRVRLFTYVVKE